MKLPKYCRVTNIMHPSVEKKINEGVRPLTKRSGCMKWLDIFKGDIDYFTNFQNNDLEKYDVIHINLCGGDVGLIKTVRDALPNSSSVKIVANIDYGVEDIQRTFGDPSIYKYALRGADYYFATEPFQAALCSRIINDKPVKIIPHPIDVKFIKKRQKEQNNKKALMISAIYHSYDDQIDMPYWTISDLGLGIGAINLAEDGRPRRGGLSKYLFNYTKNADCNWEDWLDILDSNFLLFETYTQHSYGRATVEAAALGVPVVGSHLVASMRRCYPKTSCDPLWIPRCRELIIKLRDDEKFYKEVSDYAIETSEYYNLENSKKRFLELIEW